MIAINDHGKMVNLINYSKGCFVYFFMEKQMSPPQPLTFL